MSRRNKLEKFSDLLSFSNVYEYSDKGRKDGWAYNEKEDVLIKGGWNKHQFENENPIILELACGRGEYTCALSELNDNKNFIGIDVKGARIWKGAKYAINYLPNAAFLRIRIEHIADFFTKDEVDEIWITFPDPFLKSRKADRRLTSLPFLERYRNILKKDGFIHLKTDDDQLYEYTLEIIEKSPYLKLIYKTNDIYANPLYSPELEFKTYYENQHLNLGKKIKYVKFRME
ncbi:MAG: tRNA (guanosine(46)-N7)-methyltransferase TrmB [Saprospiraceae bacterium]